MVVNDLEEHSGSVYTGHHDGIVKATLPLLTIKIARSYNLEDHNFES